MNSFLVIRQIETGGLIWINKPIKLEYKVCEIKKLLDNKECIFSVY